MGNVVHHRGHDKFHFHRVFTISHCDIWPAAYSFLCSATCHVWRHCPDRSGALHPPAWHCHAYYPPVDDPYSAGGVVCSLGYSHGCCLAGSGVSRARDTVFQHDGCPVAAHLSRIRADRRWRGTLAAPAWTEGGWFRGEKLVVGNHHHHSAV